MNRWKQQRDEATVFVGLTGAGARQARGVAALVLLWPGHLAGATLTFTLPTGAGAGLGR